MPDADLTEQPVRSASRCPDCGGEPSDVTHRLRANGYLHDDQVMVCEECGHQWTCGVPIGEFDRPELAADLICSSCEGDQPVLIHRVRPDPAHDLRFHVKCPREDCNYFSQFTRDFDDGETILMGYPSITGQTEGATPHGYAPPEDAADANGGGA